MRRAIGPRFARLALLALTAAGPHGPSDPAAQLHAAEAQRAAGLTAQHQAEAEAEAARQRADELAAARVAAAARLRAAEEATSRAAVRMEDLAAQRAEAERRLAQQAANLGPLLPLIERLALYPVETLLAVPGSIDETLQGVVVLRGITRDMQRQAAALRAQQDHVAALTRDMRLQAPALAAAQQQQAGQAALLDAQLAQARQNVTAAQRQAEAAARAAAEAAGRAATLREVIATIEAARAKADNAARHKAGSRAPPDGPGAPGLSLAAGINAPVAGRVIRAFGAPSDAGPATGISYQPPPAARVVSPCSGQILFSGPFRSYGRLLIIHCGRSDDFVLAGLDRLDVPVGRSVRQGEPVGAMPGWDPTTLRPRPALYVELRRAGTPIDPAPFLRRVAPPP